MTRVKAPLAYAGTALLAAAVVACGSADTSKATTAGASAKAKAPPAQTAASAARLTTARRAIATARKAVPSGRPYDLERERYRGTTVWEVKLASGATRPHELYIRNDGRKVVRHHRKARRSTDARRVAHARISLARALSIASRRASGALSEGEIDTHRGKLVWEVEFNRSRNAETEVKVDAKTGRVVSVRHESDD